MVYTDGPNIGLWSWSSMLPHSKPKTNTLTICVDHQFVRTWVAIFHDYCVDNRKHSLSIMPLIASPATLSNTEVFLVSSQTRFVDTYLAFRLWYCNSDLLPWYWYTTSGMGCCLGNAELPHSFGGLCQLNGIKASAECDQVGKKESAVEPLFYVRVYANTIQPREMGDFYSSNTVELPDAELSVSMYLNTSSTLS